MSDLASRRAERLALLYPRAWRQQYPDFVAVLASQLTEHPRGARGDVIRAAAVERLRAAGVVPARPADRARSGLALVYASLVPFAGLSMGMWSQLHTTLAGQRSAPPVLRSADLVLGVGTVVALASLAGAAPLVAVHARRRRTDNGAGGITSFRPIALPALGLVMAMATLTVGGWAADRSAWYSPAAAALPADGAGHLLTLWLRDIIATITPAWVHPSLFGRMPAGELVAALVAPLAVVAAGVALLRLIVRLPLLVPQRVHVAGAVTSVGAMLLSTAATLRWLLAPPRPGGATPPLAHVDHLAPGHTAWAVLILLSMLAVTAVAGARWVLQSRVRPPGPKRGRVAPAGGRRCRGGTPTADATLVVAEP